MIPEGAVEAAAWAIYASDTPTTTASGLSDLDRYTRNDILRQARAALEAAYPHMAGRTITNAEGLDALPIGSVILGYDDDLDQLVSRKSVDEYWQQAGTDDGWQAAGIIQWYGSVTVLHEP